MTEKVFGEEAVRNFLSVLGEMYQDASKAQDLQAKFPTNRFIRAFGGQKSEDLYFVSMALLTTRKEWAEGFYRELTSYFKTLDSQSIIEDKTPKTYKVK